MNPTTITATMTMPLADIEAFADAKGYMEQIEDPNDNTQMIPNPVSRVDFVKNLFVEHALDWFVGMSEHAIRVAKQTEADAAVKVKKDELHAAITIA